MGFTVCGFPLQALGSGTGCPEPRFSLVRTLFVGTITRRKDQGFRGQGRGCELYIGFYGAF